MKTPQTITVFAKFTDDGWIHVTPDNETKWAMMHIYREFIEEQGIPWQGKKLPTNLRDFLFSPKKKGFHIRIMVSFIYGVRELVLDKENPHQLVLADFAGHLATVPNERRFFAPAEMNLQGFCEGGNLTIKPVAKK